MKAVEVGGDVLQLPTDVFDAGDQKGTIIDSGTTLAYVPEEVYDPMLKKVHNIVNSIAHHSAWSVHSIFWYLDLMILDLG